MLRTTVTAAIAASATILFGGCGSKEAPSTEAPPTAPTVDLTQPPAQASNEDFANLENITGQNKPSLSVDLITRANDLAREIVRDPMEVKELAAIALNKIPEKKLQPDEAADFVLEVRRKLGEIAPSDVLSKAILGLPATDRFEVLTASYLPEALGVMRGKLADGKILLGLNKNSSAALHQIFTKPGNGEPLPAMLCEAIRAGFERLYGEPIVTAIHRELNPSEFTAADLAVHGFKPATIGWINEQANKICDPVNFTAYDSETAEIDLLQFLVRLKNEQINTLIHIDEVEAVKANRPTFMETLTAQVESNEGGRADTAINILTAIAGLNSRTVEAMNLAISESNLKAFKGAASVDLNGKPVEIDSAQAAACSQLYKMRHGISIGERVDRAIDETTLKMAIGEGSQSQIDELNKIKEHWFKLLGRS